MMNGDPVVPRGSLPPEEPASGSGESESGTGPARQPDWQADLERARQLSRSVASAAEGTASDRWATLGDRLVLAIASHWLALFNLAVLIYLSMPFLAPFLMQVGAPSAARLIYTVYSPVCHQLPDRSYFLFGDQVVYSLDELLQAGVLPGTNILVRRRYIGDETLGWKVALCERDVAIYGAVFLGGVLFSLLRRRVPRLSFKAYLLLLLPIAVDGLTQLFGLRSSNWLLRTITGAIFGLASVWLAYPYIEESMQDVRRGIRRKLVLQQQMQDLLHETGQMLPPEL